MSKETVIMTKAPEGAELNSDEKWMCDNFTNGYIFSKILRDNPQITKELIQLFVSDIEILEIQSIRSEVRQDGWHDSKTTYLDVEAVLTDGTVVLIEMQVKSVPDFVPRMRYYRSEADIRKLHHGESYGNLPNVIQIIICLFDPIGEGRYIYDYEMREKNSNTPLKDNGQRMIFLNCKGFRGEIADEQFDFVKYLRGEEASGNLAKNVDATVTELKYDENAKGEYMHFEDYVKDRADEARAQGRTEGRAETKAEDLALVFNMLRSEGKDEEAAVVMLSEAFGICLDEIHRIIEMHSVGSSD